MRMTYMSCEAVTAGLVLTGLVHADPHEGNIMLVDDGRLVFLDFGLMSRVDDAIMEAFASGIQVHRLPHALIPPLPPHPTSSASTLQCVCRGLRRPRPGVHRHGFVGSPIEWRPKDGDPWSGRTRAARAPS